MGGEKKRSTLSVYDMLELMSLDTHTPEHTQTVSHHFLGPTSSEAV